MLCPQTEHMSLPAYLAKFKGKVEVIKEDGGNPGFHPGAVKLVYAEHGLTVDSLLAAGTESKHKEICKEAAQQYLIALLFDRLRNDKYNELKKDIANQALHGKDSVPRIYGKVLKLAGG